MIPGSALGAGATVLVLAACGGGDGPRLSALLVALDTTRTDALSTARRADPADGCGRLVDSGPCP